MILTGGAKAKTGHYSVDLHQPVPLLGIEKFQTLEEGQNGQSN